MVDRPIIYPSAIPQDTDLLNTNKNVMIGIGYLLQAILGTGTLVDGLACTPTSPAGMTVNVAGGSIYSLQAIDATAYGSIASDTVNQIVKQGIVIPKTNFACPAPGTTGQSVVYLIQAAYQDVDAGPVVLPYYNASNPAVPYSGPNNSGTPNNTVRKGVCALAVKTGVAATTGTQVAPSPDAGYVGLYAITVANGATSITSGNIVQLSTAPFINPKLAAVNSTIQAGTPICANDTSGAANTITIALNPAPGSLTALMQVRVKVANTSTGAVVMNTNGLGNVAVVDKSGAALTAGAFVANGIYDLVYDGAHWQTASQLSASGVTAGSYAFANITVGADGRVSSANSGAAATSASLGIVQPDGTIITVAGGVITVAKASSSNFGVAKPDNTTITSTAGVLSAPFQLMTPLGVGAVIYAANNSGSTISAGSTTAAANLDPQQGSSSGVFQFHSTGDSLSGTWKAMSTVVATPSASGGVTLFQRIL